MRRPACTPGSRVRYRANIKLSKEQDKILGKSFGSSPKLHNALTQSRKDLRIVELFAGSGGMGIGFLMASDQNKGFKIVHSSEINPICLRSLKRNYKYFSKNASNRIDDCIPSDFIPTDLTKRCDREKVKEAAKKVNGADILIGGTPCQGFSASNRRGWDSKSCYNRLVEYFVQCALELKPKVILLENVQGILWTPKNKKTKRQRRFTVVDHISKSLEASDYVLFPGVLDAAWYGVPQHRNRFFLLGLHKSLGYTSDYFGEWGAFPLPTHGLAGKYDYVTVGEAISDLPEVDNGEKRIIQNYRNPTKKQLESNPFLAQMRMMANLGVIEGHIVSRQADYVIERYKHIPPGGNWQNIRHLMTNYTNIDRTHSNIYRRLQWDEPSVTIGNYRKSMIVHPKEDRGLSLREATRLQSLPDWFTLCGTTNPFNNEGIIYKQQQLANTVSFLLTLEIAKYILRL